MRVATSPSSRAMIRASSPWASVDSAPLVFSGFLASTPSATANRVAISPESSGSKGTP
jgi:hypothetical protein